jgi:hypothetical protein
LLRRRSLPGGSKKSFATTSTVSSNTVAANCLSAVFSAEHVR